MKVFALWNGCYSDAHVVGIYSTHERAEMAARIFRDNADIEKFTVDTEVDAMERGEVPYFVRLHRETGDVLDCHESTSSYGVYDSRVGEDVNKNLHTTCWAANSQHAVKIAGDRRRMFLGIEVTGAEA